MTIKHYDDILPSLDEVSLTYVKYLGSSTDAVTVNVTMKLPIHGPRQLISGEILIKTLLTSNVDKSCSSINIDVNDVYIVGTKWKIRVAGDNYIHGEIVRRTYSPNKALIRYTVGGVYKSERLFNLDTFSDRFVQQLKDSVELQPTPSSRSPPSSGVESQRSSRERRL